MGEFSIWHWLVVLMVVLLLFGGGKVSGLMGDLAKGIKAFKKTMAEDEAPAATRPATKPEALEASPTAAAPAATASGTVQPAPKRTADTPEPVSHA